jgi:hypothetical protein
MTVFTGRPVSDGDFTYGLRALAQVMGTAMLRLSEASVIPLEFGAVEAGETLDGRDSSAGRQDSASWI